MTPSSEGLGRLRGFVPVFGLMQTIPSVEISDLAIRQGVDFVILDCQDGMFDDAALAACLGCLSRSSTLGAVRGRRCDVQSVAHYLALGASVVLMPEVDTAAEARAFVASAQAASTPAPFLIAMIESGEGVANAAEIAATPGISGLVIGPQDLSADLGCANDFSAARYREAFAAVERAATGACKVLGSRAHAHFPLERLLDHRHTFILADSDRRMLADGLAALAQSGPGVDAVRSSHGTRR